MKVALLTLLALSLALQSASASPRLSPAVRQTSGGSVADGRAAAISVPAASRSSRGLIPCTHLCEFQPSVCRPTAGTICPLSSGMFFIIQANPFPFFLQQQILALQSASAGARVRRAV